MTAVGMLEEKLLLQKWGRKQAEGSHWTRPVEWSELWEETGIRRTREGQADQEDPPSSQKNLCGYIGIRLGERKQKPRPWAGEAQGRGRGEKCWEEPPVGTEWDLSWVPLTPGHLYCKPSCFREAFCSLCSRYATNSNCSVRQTMCTISFRPHKLPKVRYYYLLQVK